MDFVQHHLEAFTVAARESPILSVSFSVLEPLIKVSYDLHFSRPCC